MAKDTGVLSLSLVEGHFRPERRCLQRKLHVLVICSLWGSGEARGHHLYVLSCLVSLHFLEMELWQQWWRVLSFLTLTLNGQSCFHIFCYCLTVWSTK